MEPMKNKPVVFSVNWYQSLDLTEAAYADPQALTVQSQLADVLTMMTGYLTGVDSAGEVMNVPPVDLFQGVTIRIKQHEPITQELRGREVIRHGVQFTVSQEEQGEARPQGADDRPLWVREFEQEYLRVYGEQVTVVNRGSGWYRINWGPLEGLGLTAYRAVDIMRITESMKAMEERKNVRSR